MPEIVTTQQFAELLSVTEKAVRDWIEDGMPIKKRGSRGGGKERDRTQIDLRAAVRWYFRTNAESLELRRQQAGLAREQRERVALENAERRGELVLAARIRQHLERAFSAFRQKMLGAPTKLAAVLSPENPKRARDIIAAEHDEILSELAAHFERGGRGDLGGRARPGRRRAQAANAANGH